MKRIFVRSMLVMCAALMLMQAADPNGGGVAAQLPTPPVPKTAPKPSTTPTPAPTVTPAPAPAKPYHPAPSANVGAAPKTLKLDVPTGSKVVVIPIHGDIELGLSAFVQRMIADNDDAVAIVLDVNTFGGRVDAAVQIRDALLDAKPRTVAFVHPRAISAGALISLGCDNIIVSKSATIGAATPVQQGSGGKTEAVGEKTTSYMRAEMRTTAEANGRRGDIAEAMVDRDVEIEGVSEAGKLLTLDTDGAIKTGIADSIAENLDVVYEQLGLWKPTVVTGDENWGERIARFLTAPTVSGLLLSIGMLGIMVAFYTRQVGPFTMAGFVCLALFFGGHSVVHLVGWEEMLLFVAGIALLLAEMFVIPGFGVVGGAGIAAILASVVLALFATPIDVSIETGVLASSMTRVLVSLLASFGLAAVVIRALPKTAFGKQLILEGDQAGYLGTANASEKLIGQKAVALTDLRPSGRIEVDGVRYDATSERRFIERGSAVRVIGTQGPEYIVRPEEDR